MRIIGRKFLILGWQETFCVSFSKFHRIVEKALKASILSVYKGSLSIFRTITKSWIWTLIASHKWIHHKKSSEHVCFMNFIWLAKQRKQQETHAVRWLRTHSQFVQRNIGSIGLKVITSNSMIYDTGRLVEMDVDVLKQLIEEALTLTTRCLAERFGCSYTTVETYLSELVKTWKYGVWIPHELSPHQLQLRMDTCMG